MNACDIARQIQDMTDSALNARGIETEQHSSNQSLSSYVIVAKRDEDGYVIEEFKIRFSDHADRYGSDLTIRIEGAIEDEFDEGGNYVLSSIEQWKASKIVDEAVSAAVAWINC